ncbi:response regulator [Pseudodesulfovibrio sp. JC047]|uniref:hybrid sensor histidine kinase/response regulator n=1 Tax=Pseudodesulfovibrio sp. JC047 TaxID=2683199 RepID=UPI0013D631AD|nr:response regulator [Pseudodesulfovibrio sp. JC047]NDV18164.1 response regulator [Pseudodesulfovibrio sp. JC047]
MKLLVLAGKLVESTSLAPLLEGHEYTMVHLSSVSRGVRRLDKMDVDCVLLVPDQGDATWTRAIRRVCNEYETHVIAVTRGPQEKMAFVLGAFDCFPYEQDLSANLFRSLRHLENRLALERQVAKERVMYDWMEEIDHFGRWEMNADGHVSWSKGFRRIMDRGCHSLNDAFSSIRSCVHPEDIEVFDRANEATFEQGWPLDFEYRVRGKDGLVNYLHVNREVERDDAGGVRRAYGMVRDVSLQKELEELLFRRDAILQVLTSFASRFLRKADWGEDFDSALDDLGKAADVTRLFFFSRSGEAPNADVLSLRHEWVAEGISTLRENPEYVNQSFSPQHDAWRALLLRRKIICGHVKNFRKNERAIFDGTGTKSVMIVPVFAGNIWWGFLGFSEHRMEREWLPVEIDSLTLAANIFGSAIHYKRIGEKLVSANRSAEEASAAALEANLAKSMFLANMSHEIRTPISGILGMAEMVVTTGLTDEQREHVDMIRDAAGSLLNIVNDILDISKIEAGKMELTFVDFNFRSTLETCVRSFGPQADSGNIVFRYSVGDDVPNTLNGDPDRLGQVLWNLLGNALKFTERGLVELTVSVSRRESDRMCLLFKVRDTGTGIAADKLETIFDSFTQADSSLRKKHQGTGLGLTISRQLVNMMGGEIGVESQEGFGSIFHFTAWFGVARQRNQEVARLPLMPKTMCLNILLAEDNSLNLKYLTHFLSMFGHTITTAENGIEALNILETHGQEIDLVLMDVQMPEMSGIEATQAIRASDGKLYDRSIPIIALTAYAMKGDKERMLEAGMTEYVSKPVDMHELSDAIFRSMGERVPQGTAPVNGNTVSPDGGHIPVSLDMQALIDRFEGNMTLLKDILDLFVVESEEKLRNLDEAVTIRDAKKVGASLHSITNMASHVLAMDLVRKSRELEKRCYLGQLDSVIEELAIFKKSFKVLVAIVEAEAVNL